MFDSLNLNEFTFVFASLNLLILYFVLKRILFKPVTKIMEDRVQSIRDSIDNAEKSKLDAAELKQKYIDQLKTAKIEADKILEDSRSRAVKEYDEIIENAKQNADAILTKAREEIERERLQMIKDVRGQVASLALSVASKVIEANMDTQKNKVLVDKLVDDMGAA